MGSALSAELNTSGAFLALSLDLEPPAGIGKSIQKIAFVVAGWADQTLAGGLLPSSGNLTLVDAQVPRDQAEAGASVLLEVHECVKKFL
jgi:hypothetical protein